MKTFNQYITELFDKPLEFEELPWIERNTTLYVFILDDKNYYRVFFKRSDSRNHYEISFNHVEKQDDIYNPNTGKTIVLSGKNSIKVFSTVIAITKDFLKNKKNVTGILFVAADNSDGRKALYNRLSEKLASELKWNHSIHSEDEAYGVVYYVKKYKTKK